MVKSEKLKPKENSSSENSHGNFEIVLTKQFFL